MTKERLNDALTTISKVLTANNPLPIMNNFLFCVKDEWLHLTAMDAENTMTADVELESAEGEGEFSVEARILTEAVRNLPDVPLVISYDPGTGKLVVKHNIGSFALPTEGTNEFPYMQKNDMDRSMNIPADMLQTAVTRALFATAQDELRPVMNNVCFDRKKDELTVVASDGHRLVKTVLAEIKTENEGWQGKFLLPKKPAAILKSCLKSEDTVTISYNERMAQFTTSRFTLLCRLYEGRYPNYNAVIPVNLTNIIQVDRKQLLSTLKRLIPFSNDGTKLIKFTVANGLMVVNGEDTDFNKKAQETLECEYNGMAMEIGFKGSHIVESLENIPGPTVEIRMKEPTMAALFFPQEQKDGMELTILQMPMLVV